MGQFGQPCPKPLPKLLDKRQAKREARRDEVRIKALVRARDQHQCRCCGRKDSLEVHEVRPRSIGGVVSLQGSVTLCKLCHQLAQQYRLQIEGASCDGPLLFTMSQRIADLVFPSGRIPPQVRVVSEV